MQWEKKRRLSTKFMVPCRLVVSIPYALISLPSTNLNINPPPTSTVTV